MRFVIDNSIDLARVVFFSRMRRRQRSRIAAVGA
jgi:hypothetical protein